MPDNKDKEHSLPRPLGVSVHYLSTCFLEEVVANGGSRDSSIYEIEDLRFARHGAIRQKGADIIDDDTDGDSTKHGVAYVDALDEPDIGPATFMLSYCWAYKLGDILDTLEAYCAAEKLNAKDTYAWICCLTVNQHRVFEDKQSGVCVPFEELHRTFHTCVTSIGSIVAMMAPWNDPVYLTRIWCIFEVYTATVVDGCKVTIAMPSSERKAMLENLHTIGIDSLLTALARTKIETAKASVEEDRSRILRIVQEGIGYEKLNQIVNDRLREWVMKGFEEAAASLREEHCLSAEAAGEDDDLKFANFCCEVGAMMQHNGEYAKALSYYEQAIGEVRLHETADSNDSVIMDVHNGIGLVHWKRGDLDAALSSFRTLSQLEDKHFGRRDPRRVRSYSNIGLVLCEMGRFKDALVEHKNALAICLEQYGEMFPLTAEVHTNIGLAYWQIDELTLALQMFKKVLQVHAFGVQHGMFEEIHPLRAQACMNIGNVCRDRGDLNEAVRQYNFAKDIYRTLHGRDFPDTAMAYENIGLALAMKGEYDAALEEYRVATEIRSRVYPGGVEHPLTARTLRYVKATAQVSRDANLVINERGDIEGLDKNAMRRGEFFAEQARKDLLRASIQVTLSSNTS